MRQDGHIASEMNPTIMIHSIFALKAERWAEGRILQYHDHDREWSQEDEHMDDLEPVIYSDQ